MRGKGGGGGVSKANFLKENLKLNWNSKEVGGLKQKAFHGRGIIFFLEQHNALQCINM